MIDRAATVKPYRKDAVAGSRPLGEIRADSAYTLVEFARRLGLGKRAIRSLRHHGLPVVKLFGSSGGVVLGRDFISIVEKLKQPPDL